MPTTASIRDLRNRFPHIRKLVEADGEVLLTEGGKARYRLTLHTPATAAPAPHVDYWARLTAYQPTALTAGEARSLREANRGDR